MGAHRWRNPRGRWKKKKPCAINLRLIILLCYRPNQTQGHGKIYRRLGGRPHRILVGFRIENEKLWFCVFFCSTSSRAQHGPAGSDTLAPVSTCANVVTTHHGHGGRDVLSFRIKNKSPPLMGKTSVTITKE